MTPEKIALINTLSVICLILFIVAFALAAGLFFLFLFKRKAKKSLALFNLETPQELNESEAQYFTSINFDKAFDALILKRNGEIKKAVVTVVYKGSDGKSEMKRYKLAFDDEAVTVIKFDKPITDYRVVIESIDGKIIKHPALDNHFLFTAIYGGVVSGFHLAGTMVYIAMCAQYVRYSWPGYAAYYLFLLGSLLFAGFVIGGYFLVEFLSKKGVL